MFHAIIHDAILTKFRLPQAVAAAREAGLTDERASGCPRGLRGEAPNKQEPQPFRVETVVARRLCGSTDIACKCNNRRD